ncbi:MAG: PSD1 and planctomycete cytochrome C domain-containing protein, partial [Chthoniobacteraceae bacterium]
MPRSLFTPGRLTFALLCAAIAARVGAAEDPGSAFDREVKPLLAEHCFKCHGPEKQKGGLRLDAKALMLGGGDSGDPAIVTGDSAESPLVARVTSNDPDDMMPPKGERLNAGQIAALRHWIDDGAHWPGSSDADEHEEIATAPGMSITDADRAFWAFQRPRHHDVPPGEQPGWAHQPIDHFVLAKLREHGLDPSPEAPRAVLLRRLSLDLTGLPPTPEEADAFRSDTTEDALDRAADRLLSSPRFGEHLASLWLPLARYAEDQAHQVGDDTKFFYPNAWRYRAWVIEAFNRDLPYDQFLRLQLAADQMDSAKPADLAALGFLGLGPKYYDRGKIAVQADEWEDRVDTVTRTMLGLTVACARCHDHKFDPISTRDYYALAGVFASTRMVNRTPDGSDEKENAKSTEMNPEVLHVVADAEPRDLRVFIRGNPERPGAKVGRRFLEVLATQPAPAFSKDASGRRDLAECIASDRNPLTARVFVNRVWALFFGKPLVTTPSNFGHSGALPSHPDLLDDLAARFMENGWSVKQLVREIV